MSEGLSKDVPSYVIVLLLVNGFFFSFLSPIILFLKTQKWANPFIQNTTPSESLSSIALILLFALIAGLPGILLRDCITGNRGLFARLNINNKKEEKKIEKTTFDEYFNYAIWLRSNGLNKYLAFLNLKYAIVNGFFLGSILAFIANCIAFFPILFLFKELLPFFFLILLDSLLFSYVAVLYDRLFFRDIHAESEAHLKKRYEDERLNSQNR